MVDFGRAPVMHGVAGTLDTPTTRKAPDWLPSLGQPGALLCPEAECSRLPRIFWPHRAQNGAKDRRKPYRLAKPVPIPGPEGLTGALRASGGGQMLQTVRDSSCYARR